MSGDVLYRLLKSALGTAVWRGELVSEVELPSAGPAVFVANHASAMGPIAVACSLPMRLHTWVIGEMLDGKKAARYLCQDFVQPELHLTNGLATHFSLALSKVTVPLLTTIGCIPVGHGRDLLATYRISVEYLERGCSLLVFPENPHLPINGRTGMRPFKTGFAHLGSTYYERTQRSLNFYPVAVRLTARRVLVGSPVTHNRLLTGPAERRRVARAIESIIAGMLANGGGPITLGVSETH